MQSLSFKKRVRSGKATQHYVDFIVSEDSLLTLLNAEDKDLITPFGWCDRNVELDFIHQFTGVMPPELASGRVMIYACPECVDIACECISAKIEFNDTKVIWKEFGYENGYEEIHFDSYKHLPQIEFDREKYMQLFSTISSDKSHLE